MAKAAPSLTLKAGREKPLQRYHPWIFSGAVAHVVGNPEPGQTVEIFSNDGQWLARAAYSPQSQIRARVWTWQQDCEVNRDFFRARLQRAWALRQASYDLRETQAFRVVHAESDGLAGVVLDCYDDWGVLQLLTAGADRWRQTIVECISELDWFENLIERSDSEVVALEGLSPRNNLLFGEADPTNAVIVEAGLRYAIDLEHGQKTGFYLDQRENRRLVRQRAEGVEALDAFCYSGGFTLSMLAGGSEKVLAIDSSQEALAALQANLELNDLPANQLELRQADVFSELRKLRDEGRQFDLIVFDPPKFAPTRQQAAAAARGYKDINLYAFKLLRAGGELFTFSCSGGIEPELFQKIVAGAAVDAERQAVILSWMNQAPDHPVGLAFPEGHYLKGLHCKVY